MSLEDLYHVAIDGWEAWTPDRNVAAAWARGDFGPDRQYPSLRGIVTAPNGKRWRWTGSRWERVGEQLALL